MGREDYPAHADAQGALRHLTPVLDADGQVLYAGRVIITWPMVQDMGHPTCMSITDADSGEPILAARAIAVTSDCDVPGIVADLTILCDPDGTPMLTPGAPLRFRADGTIREETLRVLVVEMRMAGDLDVERFETVEKLDLHPGDTVAVTTAYEMPHHIAEIAEWIQDYLDTRHPGCHALVLPRGSRIDVLPPSGDSAPLTDDGASLE